MAKTIARQADGRTLQRIALFIHAAADALAAAILTQTLRRDVNIFTLSTLGGGGSAVF